MIQFQKTDPIIQVKTCQCFEQVVNEIEFFKSTVLCTYVCMCVCVCVYIYIYIYNFE